jgi:hypothetical protein
MASLPARVSSQKDPRCPFNRRLRGAHKPYRQFSEEYTSCLVMEIEPRFLGRQVHNQVTTAYRLSYLAPFTVLKLCAGFNNLARKTSKEHEDIYVS